LIPQQEVSVAKEAKKIEDSKAFRESYLDVCLELKKEERINRVREYNGFDKDYFKGDDDRENLLRLSDLEMNMVIDQR
jgi:hypothetical protein